MDVDYERQSAKIGSWTLIVFGLLFVIFSFYLLYLGLRMLAVALDKGFPTLPAILMLVSWVLTLVISVLMVRYGWRIRRSLKERD